MFLWHIGLGVVVGYTLVVGSIGVQWSRNIARRRAKRREVRRTVERDEANEKRLWRDVDEVLEMVKF